MKIEKSDESFCPSDLFPAGGGAAQVPYGNAPVIPAGLDGKSCSITHHITLYKTYVHNEMCYDRWK